MKYLTRELLISLNVFIQQKQGTKSLIKDVASLDYIVKSAGQFVFGRALYPTAVDVSAFYFINIIKKHAFNDANKRTAVLALYASLKANDVKYLNDHDSRLGIGNLAIHLASVDGVSKELASEVKSMIANLIIE